MAAGRVLVTGASGALGAATAQALAARGDRVTVLQRRPAGLGLPEVLADVADGSSVRAAVAGHEAVVHLAAKVKVTGPWSDYERANVAGTRSIVDACRAAGVRRLVHVSSPSVAHSGSPLFGVGAEPAAPRTARGPYARSKAIAELIALAADDDQLAVLAIRPHLVWGPGDPQLVARIVDRARLGRLPLIGSGAALVDSTYVTNAVDALVAALDAGCRRIVLGVGGSANTDGGAGMLAALGVRLLDAEGRPVPDGGGGLTGLVTVDVDGLDPRLAETELLAGRRGDGREGGAELLGGLALVRLAAGLERGLALVVEAAERHGHRLGLALAQHLEAGGEAGVHGRFPSDGGRWRSVPRDARAGSPSRYVMPRTPPDEGHRRAR